MVNALFLTHKNSLISEITGGVQLCSQEFYYIINSIPEIKLSEYHVSYTKNIMQRVRMKIGQENYSMYNINKDAPALLNHITKNKIRVVFINMASLVRYARPIKETFGDNVKIILLSHGNHSGDFLHLISKPIISRHAMFKFLMQVRLGHLISTESEYRVKYLDAVITLSETEKQIENWFGAKKSVFIPRRLYPNFLLHKPILGRVGFVGRLDHPPNFQGMEILLDELKKSIHSKIEIRLIGAPVKFGQRLQFDYPFITYLGELSDTEVEDEVATWSFLLNPVWWYSTGASTKLAKAISWGIPIITSVAGMRGYQWKNGNLLIVQSPLEMANIIVTKSILSEEINYWASQTKTVANSGPDDQELITLISQATN